MAKAGEPSTTVAVAGSPALPIAQVAVPGTSPGRKASPPKAPGQAKWLAGLFLAPALILLAAILVYPLIYSFVRSLFADGPAGNSGAFTGFKNYHAVFSDESTFRAVKNNVIWVAVVPALVTILGLMFAVLSERIRWATAFKTVLFMPMAISFVASGVTFELIYSDQPSRGLANAVSIGIHDTFHDASSYPGVHARNPALFSGSASAGYTTKAAVSPGTPALLSLTGIDLNHPPKNVQSAEQASASGPGLYGVVWNDFKLGGGGKAGQVDAGEVGLPGMKIQAVQGGKVVASTTADSHGAFAFKNLTSGSYQLRLPSKNFAPPYAGLSWLGPGLITPAIIVAYLWAFAGFAMVLLAAGMAAIPRDTLEAARIDGATEWQVFRRVTAPLLTPVLLVVFVTLVINVLKVFDLVFIISQGAGANGKYADVLATQLYNSYNTQKYGVASAIGILLVLLVLPAMALNIRRFRKEQR